MRILVTGATGYAGSRLVTALLGHGHDVVVAARDPEKLGRYGWFDRVTPTVLDAADPDSADSALAVAGNVDVLYGDALRIRRLATAVLPSVAHPALDLLSAVPKPVAGVLRSGLDMATARWPKVQPA